MVENPNPNAKIGFVIYYPFQFYVYKSVYEHLKDEAEFVIDLGLFFPNRQTEDVLPAIEALLGKHGAWYRVLRYEDYRYAAYLERYFSGYEMLVSVWWRGCILFPQNRPKKKVHITYGAGKELTTLNLGKREFDLILAYGEYDHAFYSLITKSVVIGNPKFDDWFNDSLDMHGISDVVRRLNPKKKTVLYLPTHSDLSSIDELAGSIREAGEKYNVITKPHYYTPREEPQRVEKLADPNIILLQDDADLLPLLKIADVVISDNSSAIFDAVLADKPIIVANLHSPEYLDTAHQKERMYRRGVGDPLTYSGSIEQRIKKDGTVEAITSADELLPAIARVLAHDDKSAKRKKLAGRLFAYRDGNAGKRGADAIHAVRKEHSPERPFLYHAVQHYTMQVLRRPKRSATWIEEYLPARENLKKHVLLEESGVVFSIIMLPRASEHRAEALRSIREQDFQKEKYELVELPEGETFGARVHRAIIGSKGRIICFATDDCVLPSDWLSMLYLAYERHPRTPGVGGYEQATSERLTPYDEYRYREIAWKLNVPLMPGFLEKFYEVCNSIPAQNPMGDLSATSYRREVLTTLSLRNIRTSAELERFLKVQTTALCPPFFIPAPVWRLWQTTRHGFLEEMMEHGRLDTAFGIQTVHGFWSSCSEVWKTYRCVSFELAKVILAGRLAYWVGKVIGRTNVPRDF